MTSFTPGQVITDGKGHFRHVHKIVHFAISGDTLYYRRFTRKPGHKIGLYPVCCATPGRRQP